MHIKDVLDRQQPAFSFEFFPPKTEEASQTLFESISDLNALHPAYVSVTYGAGGSTRQLTHDLVVRISRDTQLTVVSHLTCVRATRDEIKAVLLQYQASGIENILAIRGDPPKGQETWKKVDGGFEFASELVGFIKREFPAMGIGVAGFPEGHPGCPNRLKEIEYLKQKVDSGADYICTQLFFDNNDFYDFCDRCTLARINVPILAGIMPITSRHGMERMAQLALGARFPARLLKSIARAENDEYVQNVGIHWATEQVRDLLDNNVRGVHFYTLNKSGATKKVYESLGISSSLSLSNRQ